MNHRKWKNPTQTPTYKSWVMMRRRCYNPEAADWQHYGGHGIKVCDRWRHNYDNFVEDMGLREIGQTIERINNNGDYEPGNCRWASRKEQADNRRTNHLIFYKGKQRTLGELSDISGVHRTTIYSRLFAGDSVREAVRPLAEPIHGTGRYARGCRCEICKHAAKIYRAKTRHLHRKHEAAYRERQRLKKQVEGQDQWQA